MEAAQQHDHRRPRLLPPSSTADDDSDASQPLDPEEDRGDTRAPITAREEDEEEEEDEGRRQKEKFVCFRSQRNPADLRAYTSPAECVEYLVVGSPLTKVKSSTRQYRRFYWIDDDLAAIRWTPSTKKSSKAKLSLYDVKEVRPGKNTEVMRSKEVSGAYSADCAFSIIFGDDFSCVDLIANTPEEANFWVTGLNFLIAAHKGGGRAMENRERIREAWLEQVFERADQQQRGLLDEAETIAAMKEVNAEVCERDLHHKMLEFDFGKDEETRGRVDKRRFIALFNETCTRPDVMFIMLRYCGADFMTADDLQLFLEGEQRVREVTLRDCERLVAEHERTEEARKRKQLLVDGFTDLLRTHLLFDAASVPTTDRYPSPPTESSAVLLRIKVISGQQLPRPKGSSTKASTIDPYVKVQVTGLTVDCAESRTRTVNASDGKAPIFDESFEFRVTAPTIASLRFVVLDDDFIDDDFIGHASVPVEAMQSGYRHVPLQSRAGEALSTATLFVHVSQSKRLGAKQRLKRKRSWGQKPAVELRPVGVRAVDEALKSVGPFLQESTEIRRDLERAMVELCDECCLQESANVAQCLRVFVLRLASCPAVTAFRVDANTETDADHPSSQLGFLQVQVTGEVSGKLAKTTAAVERALGEFYFVAKSAVKLVPKIQDKRTALAAMHDEVAAAKKAERATETFARNLKQIDAELDGLRSAEQEAVYSLTQVERLSEALTRLFDREREAVRLADRDTPLSVAVLKSTLTLKSSQENTPPADTKDSPTSPAAADVRLRSILKKPSPYSTDNDASSPSSTSPQISKEAKIEQIVAEEEEEAGEEYEGAGDGGKEGKKEFL